MDAFCALHAEEFLEKFWGNWSRRNSLQRNRGEKFGKGNFEIAISFAKHGWPEIRAGICYGGKARNQSWQIQYELKEISLVPKIGLSI